jgi:hypothetical protein
MNDTRSGSVPEEGATGSWTSETLPLDIRKELLERELKRLGLRKGPVAQQQQQPQDGASRPNADKDPSHGK